MSPEDRAEFEKIRASLVESWILLSQTAQIQSFQGRNLARNEELLNAHEVMIEAHTRFQAEHQKTLAAHEAMLGVHSTIMAEHHQMTAEHHKMMAEHNEQMKGLRAHLAVLTDIVDGLIRKGDGKRPE